MNLNILNRRTLLKSGLAISLLSAVATPAFAHRQKKAQTSIEWNSNSKSLEITHILHRHDAEQALAATGKLDTPDLSSLKARAILALYIAEQFNLSDISRTPIEIEIIGAENDGPHIFAYYEAKMDAPPTGLIIRNTILQDIYPDQINHVNIRFEQEIKSAVFARGDNPKKILA